MPPLDLMRAGVRIVSGALIFVAAHRRPVAKLARLTMVESRVDVRETQRLVRHKLKRADRIDLDAAWLTLGLDGIPFRGQLRALGADDNALPG